MLTNVRIFFVCQQSLVARERRFREASSLWFWEFSHWERSYNTPEEQETLVDIEFLCQPIVNLTSIFQRWIQCWLIFSLLVGASRSLLSRHSSQHSNSWRKLPDPINIRNFINICYLLCERQSFRSNIILWLLNLTCYYNFLFRQAELKLRIDPTFVINNRLKSNVITFQICWLFELSNQLRQTNPARATDLASHHTATR